MSTSTPPAARLLFRVNPVPHESPRGYLCRVAQEHGYSGPLLLLKIAGVPPSRLELEDGIIPVSHMLRLGADEWRAICYRRIKGPGRFKQRSFHGERISADDLNYGCPRLCPACLRERPIWWAVWDLGLVTACPIHRCMLLDRCPVCKRNLAWHRPAVHKCRCGLDLGNLAAEAAGDALVVINTAIYQAAGFPLDGASTPEFATYRFPPEVLALRLGSLLRLLLFLGSIRGSGRLRRKQKPFAATELAAAAETGRAAVEVLKDWPAHLRDLLKSMLPPQANSSATLKFNAIFGNFYRHLFRVLPRSEVGFLRDVFERFVIEDWEGPIRGQHRYFSPATRRSSQWIPAEEAERMARTRAARISDVVRQGQIEGMFLNIGRARSHVECWLMRDSLKRWILARELERTRYMPRTEAEHALGLTKRTIVKAAAAGAMRYVQGPQHGFPSGHFFFLREDVNKIQCAFKGADVRALKCARARELIALGHAIKNYLGRGPGLAAVIRAVVDGNLVPVGYTDRFRGITGYLFLSDELGRYRPVENTVVTAEGFLNYHEAAAALGVKPAVVRGLVCQGILRVCAGYRNGVSKLIPAADVRRMCGEHVAVTALAARLGLNGNAFASFIRKSGLPLTAVPVPERGRGLALFVSTEVAAEIGHKLSTISSRTSNSSANLRGRKQRCVPFSLALIDKSAIPCQL